MKGQRGRGRNSKTEVNRNRSMRFGGALTTKRAGPSDSPGASSSRARSTKTGADQPQSVMAGRAGAGSSGGTGVSRDAMPGQANRRGRGIKNPKRD